MLEELESYYGDQATRIEIQVDEDGTISVEIVYEGDNLDIDLKTIEGYNITQNIGGSARTSWCERYGEIDEIWVNIMYVPKESTKQNK